jgi:hypothetical protein
VYYNPAVHVLHIKREASRQSTRAQYEFWRAGYIFYKKHYADKTSLPIHAVLVAGLAAKGGMKLVRDMMRPIPPAPNQIELH